MDDFTSTKKAIVRDICDNYHRATLAAIHGTNNFDIPKEIERLYFRFAALAQIAAFTPEDEQSQLDELVDIRARLAEYIEGIKCISHTDGGII